MIRDRLPHQAPGGRSSEPVITCAGDAIDNDDPRLFDPRSDAQEAILMGVDQRRGAKGCWSLGERLLILDGADC